MTKKSIPESGFLGPLRATALIAVVIGALGSVGLTLRAGHRNPSLILMGLFTIWVLFPFAALLWATVVSKRWPAATRATLYSLMLVVTAGSLGIYGYVALGHTRAKPAGAFLVVPAVSLVLIAIVVAMSRPSRQLR